MPKLPKEKLPKYRKHKGKGLAVVTLGGKDIYLGKYGSKESREEYNRLVGEWLQCRGAPTSEVVDTGPTVVELCRAYWNFAQGYYRGPDGKPTQSLDRIQIAIRQLRPLYGNTPAREFGPLALQAVRQTFIDHGYARTYCNSLTDTIRRIFRWATTQELVSSHVYEALRAVPGLRKGRTTAPEPKPIPPVPDEVVTATLPHLPPIIADMVRIQRLVGCRPGEIVIMRPIDIDRRGEVWIFRPPWHKTSWQAKSRAIAIGPRAQAILMPYLDRPEESYCFSPAEGRQLQDIEKRRRRKTPVQPSQVCRKKKNPKRFPGELYDVQAYGRAVTRAAVENGLPRWTPNQLRKTAATEIRETFGLEAAKSVLGHHETVTTETFYATQDLRRAAEVAKQIG